MHGFNYDSVARLIQMVIFLIFITFLSFFSPGFFTALFAYVLRRLPKKKKEIRKNINTAAPYGNSLSSRLCVISACGIFISISRASNSSPLRLEIITARQHYYAMGIAVETTPNACEQTSIEKNQMSLDLYNFLLDWQYIETKIYPNLQISSRRIKLSANFFYCVIIYET